MHLYYNQNQCHIKKKLSRFDKTVISQPAAKPWAFLDQNFEFLESKIGLFVVFFFALQETTGVLRCNPDDDKTGMNRQMSCLWISLWPSMAIAMIVNILEQKLHRWAFLLNHGLHSNTSDSSKKLKHKRKIYMYCDVTKQKGGGKAMCFKNQCLLVCVGGGMTRNIDAVYENHGKIFGNEWVTVNNHKPGGGVATKKGGG